MTTHRRYTFVHPGAWTSGGHSKALELLERQCEQNWWYNEPQVKGEALNKLIIEFTCSGRDQWWVHQRAMKLAAAVYVALGLPESNVPEPLWESLEPHRNRGRWRIPTTPAGSQP